MMRYHKQAVSEKEKQTNFWTGSYRDLKQKKVQKPLDNAIADVIEYTGCQRGAESEAP